MPGPTDSLDKVPLLDVLPRGYAAAADRLLRLAHELEVHPVAAGRMQWHWYPEHNTKPAVPLVDAYKLVFDTTITLFDRGSDSLELALDVGWCPDLTVNASVEVACWCSTYHNIHQVREGQWPVGDTEELVAAFSAGVVMVKGVLDTGPFDPRPWRLDAGLPDAPSATR